MASLFIYQTVRVFRPSATTSTFLITAFFSPGSVTSWGSTSRRTICKSHCKNKHILRRSGPYNYDLINRKQG